MYRVTNISWPEASPCSCKEEHFSLVPTNKERMAKATHLVVLKVIMVLIFTGWVCVWIIRPTEMWKNSWKRAEQSTRNPLFGSSGLDLLVFTLPIILVAILGFIHLHLSVTNPKTREGSISRIKLSNPVIIRRPIGIVSGVELLIATMFIFFLGWTFYRHISNDFRKMGSMESDQLKPWQDRVMAIGIRLGWLAEACLALLLLPISRGMPLAQLLGLQFEVSVRYHVWLGNIVMIFSTLHGCIIMFIWGINHNLQKELPKWQKTGCVNLAGEIVLVIGFVMWITSIPQIRRKNFEIFFYTHHLYALFIVFYLFHVGDRHFYTIFSGILLFSLDKLLRVAQSRMTTQVLYARILPCNAIELVLLKHPNTKYSPTSMVFVKIPIISEFQWHPFSISSSANMDNDSITIIAKCQGKWTTALYDTINGALGPKSGHIKCLSLAVEGPYGPTSNYYQRYDNLLLVAGGSGITPFLSILQEVISHKGNTSKFTPKIQLIYVVKRSHDLTMLNTVSPLLLRDQQGCFKLEGYVTKEERPTTTLRELMPELPRVQTVTFDTNCSGYAMLIPESLLQRATITGLFFVVFLVSLGFLNSALVHPENYIKKKQPSLINNFCIISAFTIAVICIGSIISFRRWRKMRKEVCTNSQVPSDNMGLDFLEERFLVDENVVHFGRRPNFQDIFSNFSRQANGSEVGVLVCGPESMQESVAFFCRRYAQNYRNDTKQKPTFSFHSLNFAL